MERKGVYETVCGFVFIQQLGRGLRKASEKEYEVRLAPEEEKVIEFVSKKLASGKRIQELRLLNRMLVYADRLMLFAGLREELRVYYGIQMSEEQKDNLINIMTNEFPAGASRTYLNYMCILSGLFSR